MNFKLKTIVALAGLGSAFGLVASLSTPIDASGYSLIGGSLGTSQRDFRVFNNFTDAQANNNQTADPDFPGALGATQAIWKGHLEWASEWYMGVGDQDPTQSALGTGQSNFDNTYQGEASSAGGNNANTHAEELNTNPGGVLAYMQGPISDGWKIRYLSAWTWQDGPGNNGSIDLQGVACHEIGHSLGLGHSNVSGATMLPSISGSGSNQRSISSDDTSGLRSIYGDKSTSKPVITSISGTQSIGGSLTIHGANFSTSGNVVWFTDANADGSSVNVSGLASTGGGTAITLTVPAGIQNGSLVVKANFSGGASISNEWPVLLGGPTGDPPNISAVNPNLGPAGGFTEVTISGAGFNGTTDVTFGGVDALSFTVDSTNQITAVTPGGTLFATVDVTVVDDESSDTESNGFAYTFNPVPDVNSIAPGSGPASGGTTVTISGPSVVGVNNVTFGGVAGTNLQVLSESSLQVDSPAGLGTVDVVVSNSQGADTLVDGFSYDAAGNFVNVGASGIGGSLGEPVFTGSGDLTPGSAAGFTMSITNAQPFALGFFFLSDQSNPFFPFFGGTFYPLPILYQDVFGFDGSGSLVINTTIGLDIPNGADIVMQFFFQDGTATAGVSGSNGLKLEIP